MFLYIYKYRVLRLEEVYSLKNGHNHRTLLATYTNVQKPTPNLATKVKVYTMTVFPARDANFEIQGTLSNVITLSLPVCLVEARSSAAWEGGCLPLPTFFSQQIFFLICIRKKTDYKRAVPSHFLKLIKLIIEITELNLKVHV